MKASLMCLLLTNAILLPTPTTAQTYSSFLEQDISSFNTIEDSFTPPNANPEKGSMIRQRSTITSYIDRAIELNHSNNSSRFTGSETAILGSTSIDSTSAKGPTLLNNSIRTTKNSCFVSLSTSINCN